MKGLALSDLLIAAKLQEIATLPNGPIRGAQQFYNSNSDRNADALQKCYFAFDGRQGRSGPRPSRNTSYAVSVTG